MGLWRKIPSLRRAKAAHGERQPEIRKVIHFHLEKTAGTSINRWLELLSEADRTRPADYDNRFFESRNRGRTAHPCRPEDLALHKDLGRESLERWDIVHGHSPGLIAEGPSTFCFTILRDPTARFLSFLRDWRRLNPQEILPLREHERNMRRDAMETDAIRFLEIHAEAPYFAQMRQTAALRHAADIHLPETERRNPNRSDLECASRALGRLFDFVGVFEELEAAVHHVSREIGAVPPAGLGWANAGRADTSLDHLSPAALEKLRTVWADDYILHDHAKKMAEMSSHPAYGEAEFERKHLQRRLAQLKPIPTNRGRGFTANDQIVGTGFHGREAANTDQVLAWSGPSARSLVYVPVPLGERLEFYLDIAGYIDDRVRNSVRLRIDGEPVAFRRGPAPNLYERLSVPFCPARDFLKVEILVDRTFSPDELGTGPGDKRLVGLALRGCGYRLVDAGANLR